MTISRIMLVACAVVTLNTQAAERRREQNPRQNALIAANQTPSRELMLIIRRYLSSPQGQELLRQTYLADNIGGTVSANLVTSANVATHGALCVIL